MQAKIVGPTANTSSAVATENVRPILGMTAEEMSALASTIAVFIPHRATENPHSGLFINAGFWGMQGLSYAPLQDNFAGFVEVTRSNIARFFLDYAKDRPSIDKLVMIDADQNVQWDAPYRLAAWDLPVVAGIVCSYTEAMGPWACVQFKDKYGVARFPSYMKTKTIPGRGIKEAHSVGTGLIFIKKQVLEAIFDSGDYPFRIESKVRDSCFETGTLKQGEDIAFSRQCEKLGFKRYVDFSVHAVHYKYLGIQWPKDGIDHNLNPSDWEVNDRDYHHG
jgi:hypothetical protein